MRITSHREKFLKRNGNRNIQCIVTTENENDRINSPCFINKKIYHLVVFVAVLKVMKTYQTVLRGCSTRENIVSML